MMPPRNVGKRVTIASYMVLRWLLLHQAYRGGMVHYALRLLLCDPMKAGIALWSIKADETPVSNK
jgi:hypothetical protein